MIRLVGYGILLEPHFLTHSVYDWETQSKLNVFVNPNPYGSRISALRFINEEDVSLMLAASDEGMIRLYRNYASASDTTLVSSWKGLLDYASPIPPRGKGIVLDWHQHSGTLLVSGHSRIIRLWDAEREMSVYVCLFSELSNTFRKCQRKRAAMSQAW